MDYSPIWISVKTASLTIVIVFSSVWRQQAGGRAQNEKIKMVLDGIFTLPLVLPPTVAGFFLLYLFGIRRDRGFFC